MKLRLILVLLCILAISMSGCDFLQKLMDQIEIANTFADFAPEFSDLLSGDRSSLSSTAKNALASTLSMEIGIDSETSSAKWLIDVVPPFSTHIKITGVEKEDFLTFLTATDIEDVPEDLQEEWEKFDELRNQDISDVSIYANSTVFDDETSFDGDTIGVILEIITVSNNIGTLQAFMSMKINEYSYEGTFKAGLIKSGDDWFIDNLELNLELQAE